MLNLKRLFRSRSILFVLTGLVAQTLWVPAVEAQTKPQTSADTVLLGGRVVTLQPDQAIAQAVAIRDGRLIVVGTDEAVAQHIGKQTKVIRLKGKMVIPGIIETHCHAIGVARASLDQPYVELSSIAEVQAWIRREAKRVPAGTWLRVPRTDITRLKELRHPTPAELDAACDTHPVAFKAARKYALNSLGFKTAGIDKTTKTIRGGRILRDDQGRAVLIAGGDSHLRKFLPRKETSEDAARQALIRVHRQYNKVGITSIFERASSNTDGYRTYQDLRKQGRLSVRMTMTFRRQFRDADDVRQFVKQLGLKPREGDDWIKAGPLKITVDGGIHWGNTHLREPYGPRRVRFYRLDDPNYRGDLRFTVERMREVFAEGHRLGWQMCCHVTGDAGVDRVLDALDAVHQGTPIDRRRFTLVHAYFPARDAIQRAKRLGVCVDTQSYLYYKDSDAIAAVYGPRWAERFIGLGDWTRGGVTVAINSDHMIGLDPNRAMNAYNPFLQMYIAVSRKNQNDVVYGRHQRISREDALRAMTLNAAYLSFDEENVGSLKPGKLADLAVLDRDYLTCPEKEIRDINVLMTMVDGKIVYQSDAWK